MVRNSEHMFEKVNISPLSIKILTFLSRSPDKHYYVREIAEIINGSVGGTHKVLKNLFDMGFIIKQKSGRNLYYKIDDSNPAIKYFKIFMNVLELDNTIKEIIPECKKIILYGSCSTGEDTMHSDIDLLIITEEPSEIKVLLKQKYLGTRKIKPIILLPHDYLKLKNKDFAFYSEINKGILLWRDSNE